MTTTPAAPNPLVQLLRRWVVDYFNSHDASAAAQFIAPGYTLEIGDYTFSGRDEQWLPAVDVQMKMFPGMGMTVHQVVAGADRVAAWFSEHGASGGPGGRTACWSGVSIYRGDGSRLTGCVAQEDYTTRSRQLKSGMCDPLDPPTPAPWDTVPLPANSQAEAAVRAWLGQSWPCAEAAVRCDDDYITGVPLGFAVDAIEICELFSSGNDVAFHVRQTGRYRSGLAGVPASDHRLVLNTNGIVQVHEDRVVSGRIIRDRSGLRARLLKA